MSKFSPVIPILGFIIVAAATACSGKSSDATTAPTDTTSTAVAYNLAIDTTVMVDSTDVEAGATVPVRLVATLDGSPAVGATVTWSIGSGNGTLSSSTSTTDSLGYAVVSWTVGDTVGLNSLTGVIGSSSVTIRAVGIAGPAASLTRVSTDSTWLVGGASTLLTARARDRFGNVVSGARVLWSATNGALSRTESISGASGNADVTFTAPTASVASTITATLEGKASIRFQVVAVYDTVNQ